jgi:hypothetical protein
MVVSGQSKEPTLGKEQSSKRPDEASLPQFPALSCCIVLDARFSSRQEIIRDLKASLLFEEIVEAKSLMDAMLLLTHRQPDACFIGPTMSLDRAIAFINEGQKKIHSGDCAFVSIIEANPEIRLQLLENGAHEVIERPCSKYTFSLGVIAAIVRANAGHPWSELAKSFGLEIDPDKFLGLDRKSSKSPAVATDREVTVRDELVDEPTLTISSSDVMNQDTLTGSSSLSSATDEFGEVTTILGTDSLENAGGPLGADFGNFFSSLEVTDLGADQHGTPSLESTEKIKNIVSSLLPDRADNPAMADLKLFLEVQMVQWIIDQRNFSKERATQNLKRKLTIFLQNQS